MALKRRAAAALGLLLLALGCSKREPAPHRTEPWLASPSASGGAAAGGPRRYHFTSDSVIRFTASGHKGKLSGHVAPSGGELRLDPRDLRSASASLEVDLTRLDVETPLPEGVELGEGSPSALALDWLELGPGVPAERRAQLKIARFELSALENLSSTWLETSARKAGAVRATAVGTLLLHGFRAPVRVELQLRAAGPERLSIRSASALVLPLEPHDITARGPSGVVDALAASRAGDWLGKSMRIELELGVEPDTGASK